jgi:hypothetical protein
MVVDPKKAFAHWPLEGDGWTKMWDPSIGKYDLKYYKQMALNFNAIGIPSLINEVVGLSLQNFAYFSSSYY